MLFEWGSYSQFTSFWSCLNNKKTIVRWHEDKFLSRNVVPIWGCKAYVTFNFYHTVSSTYLHGISSKLKKQTEVSMQSVGDKSGFLARNSDNNKTTKPKNPPLSHCCIHMQYVPPNSPFIRVFPPPQSLKALKIEASVCRVA